MDIECPYCEKGLEICHYDDFGYQEGVKHQMKCDNCQKTFVFETSIVFHYEAQKADCLNDGNHDYQLTHTFPKEFSKMECSMCGDKREITENERLKFNIGTKQSYIDSLR